MKKINVKNNQNQITNSARFSTDELCISWYNQENSTGSFPQNNTYEIIDITAELLALTESEEAKKYLASTDWMVIRKAETGLDYSQEIKTARAAARLKVL